MQFQVPWGNLQPCHLQLVPPCTLKPSFFGFFRFSESSPSLNEMLVIIAEAFVRDQLVTNLILLFQFPMIEIPCCLFFMYIEDFKLSCESDYIIHTELSLWLCTYCSPRISLVFSAVCTTCLMLHIQSGCILMEEAALSIKVSVITCRWIFVSLCFHCGFNFWIHLDQFLLPY